MKKILFISIISILLTGCTINYNLEIDGNKFNETISGSILTSELDTEEDTTDLSNENYFLYVEQPVFIDDNQIFYNKTLNNNDDKIDFEYSYSFTENNLENSRLFNNCFENYVFENNSDKYTIHLYGKFNCNTPDININISTKNKVIAHNANSYSKNTYTWNLEKQNIEDTNIYISIDKNKSNNELFTGWNTLKTVGLIILLLLSGICIIVLKKKQKQY